MLIGELQSDPSARHILEERARALATNERDGSAELGEMTLIFRLGDGCYGIPARYVHEVQPLGGYTPLPATPPCVVGLVNIRGRLSSALDIRPLLDIPIAPPLPGSFLLWVSAGGMDVALLADSIVGVRRSSGDLTPSLAATTGRAVAWVRGVDQDLVVQLDAGLLLSDQRLIVNDTVDSQE
jgi:purine-binding chemotaxis protein CheW